MLSCRPLCLGLVLLLPSAIRAQAPSTPASGNAAAAQLRAQAQQESAAGKSDDAARDYRQLLALDPGSVEDWWNLGMLQYDANDFTAAQASFARVSALAPNYGNGWALLGLSEFEIERYDAALTHLERAQTLGIRDDEDIARVSAYHLALLRIHAGAFARAADLLKSTFGNGQPPQQARIALGLAVLRVPLLPSQIDPSREGLLADAGSAAFSAAPDAFAALAHDHPRIPYLHLAWCQALARKPREAIPQCLAETTISPQSPLPWIEASRLQLLAADKPSALRSARAALRLAPDSPEAQQALAAALGAPANNHAEKTSPLLSSPPEQRIVLLYEDPSLKSTTPAEPNTAQWQQALTAYVAADYPRARADLETWLAANPSSGTGWALLGLCDFALHDDDSALIHLDRGARLGLNASTQSIDQARYTYGILLVRAGRFDEAQTVLARAAAQPGPLASQIQFALGLALLRRAELPHAVPSAERELVQSAGRIALLLQSSQYDQAFPLFQALLRRYPRAPFLHYAYGTALMALSEFDRASAQMQAERPISPHSPLPCLRLASIALRQSQSAPALQWARCAIDIAPDSVDAHYLLGRAALDSGDLTTALHELETAESLSPRSPEIHFNLARAYARAKIPAKAQQERETFLRLSAAQKQTASSPQP